ncbi:MAG: TlpA family protein disulfide reductase [Spirochaetes bacterium]|nr:TlpA family protein disulfide reductase [Spirochaetota bacterium]
MLKKLSIIIFPLLFIFTVQASGDSFRESLRKLNFEINTENINYFDFTLPDLNGNRVRLNSFQGRVIMLYFWVTWCPACRRGMPSIEALHREMQGRNFVILAVNIQENSSVVRNFIQENGYTFPVILDENGEAAARYRIRSVPTTYIIDTRGKIAGVFTGLRDWNSADVVTIFRELSK